MNVDLLCVSCRQELRKTLVPVQGNIVNCCICKSQYTLNTVVDFDGVPVVIVTPVTTLRYPLVEQQENSFEDVKEKIAKAQTPDELLKLLRE